MIFSKISDDNPPQQTINRDFYKASEGENLNYAYSADTGFFVSASTQSAYEKWLQNRNK